MNMRIRPAMSSGLAVALLSFVVSAQVRADVNVLPSLQVTDRFETPLHLEQRNDTGSRLGLTAFETPATVNVIDQEQMQALGLRTMTEAYRAAPGITAGNHPAEPGVTSMRGFSRSATGYLIDGIPAIDPCWFRAMTPAPERIEVLKGPASVLHGTGAPGAINVVTRKPRPVPTTRRPHSATALVPCANIGGTRRSVIVWLARDFELQPFQLPSTTLTAAPRG